ncbi:MAG: glycoside hydrolase [Bryobacterales bacterium]|nr:glycoside hydrolase [Bryobacterales bacterium]
MPNIYLCFVWHMHQPFYKDLISGEYQLPWTRMHALKDYYGMVQILEDFPEVHQTFNLVPSMMVQIHEYATAQAQDPFLRLALKPAEELDEDEQAFILRYFFQAHPTRMIRRYPRYGELHDGWLAADRNPKRARHFFSAPTLRDLQVLSQLAWFDEEFQEKDEEVRQLVEKGRGYNFDDQALMGRKQIEIMQRVLPAYRKFADKGQIEVSTTPFYHPILPLLCDTNIASVGHPYVPLPNRFQYPGDAQHQLERAREYVVNEFDQAPAGLWPSEGSVSDEALHIAAKLGFKWAATDNGVLTRTIHRMADCYETYRPYLWRQDGDELRMIFRDHYLSDLVGFVYSRMNPYDAANHFLNRIRENSQCVLNAGRDALVPIILDGENAWEHYELNGRTFLKELYRRIQHHPHIHALTVSEALERVHAEPLGHIFPGSWINANFDVWLGAEEDNRAWDQLLTARRTYEQFMAGPEAKNLPEERRKLAWEELLIAEGSDWNWWYGPEHFSDNKPEFDRLFRSHLANVYRALGMQPPDELSRPILKVAAQEMHHEPTAPIQPKIDGDVTSYFEWMGAGVYEVDERSGAMHGQRFVIDRLLYGADRQNLYLRLDFEQPLTDARIHFNFQHQEFDVEIRGQELKVTGDGAAEVAYQKVLELKVPLHGIDAHPGDRVSLQLSVWQGALPLDAMPRDGWLRLDTAEPGEWPI